MVSMSLLPDSEYMSARGGRVELQRAGRRRGAGQGGAGRGGAAAAVRRSHQAGAATARAARLSPRLPAVVLLSGGTAHQAHLAKENNGCGAWPRWRPPRLMLARVKLKPMPARRGAKRKA